MWVQYTAGVLRSNMVVRDDAVVSLHRAPPYLEAGGLEVKSNWSPAVAEWPGSDWLWNDGGA
jgi:hypothetical protein